MPILISEDDQCNNLNKNLKNIFEKKDEKKFDNISLSSNLDLNKNCYNNQTYKSNLYILPTKEKVWYRNNFIYLNPKSFSIVWLNFFMFIFLHCFIFYGYYILLNNYKPFSMLVGYFFGLWGGLGVTAGAHRLWSHRSYSAKLILRIFLMIGHTIAGQNNLYIWCRDHRVHHKFSETDADPHNSLRGCFFAHIGWLLCKKHPEVFIKGQKVDLSDLLTDPVVKFQMKYYHYLYLLFSLIIPITICTLIYKEDLWHSFMLASVLRYGTSLHCTWFVNSAAHLFGNRPYNQKIQARENSFVSFAAFGEGYHNYHHTFPWDYATSELSTSLNLTKKFIEIMSKLGLAYNLKRAPKSIINICKVNSNIMKENKKLIA